MDTATGGGAIAGFAARVLDVLVDRNRRTTTTLRVDLVQALAEGMVTQDEARIEQTLNAFRRACISPGAMAEIYVPAAAHHLGAHWVGDRMGFADVTIATARLQALVRAIGTRWGGDTMHVPGRRSVLMIVPDTEHHTLGAVVATGQLRQAGLSVCLRLGPSRAEVLAVLRSRVFDAAMISIGQDDRIDVSCRLIETLRAFGPKGLRVLAGGGALAGGKDVASLTGADFATQDIGEALNFCGFVDRHLAVPYGAAGPIALRV